MATELLEPFAVQEVFVDGFSDHETHNGVMSCAGYRMQNLDGEPQKVVVIRLVWPAVSTEEAIADARAAQGNRRPVQIGKRASRH